MATSSASITIDRKELINSFRRWEADQAELDSQLAESMQALAAYQSHLDGWQRQLVAEREELTRLRAAIEQEASSSAGAANAEQLRQLNQELSDARQKVASLTAVLLTRTEELRDLDRLRSEANNELAAARTREKELAAALAAQQQKYATERQQWEQQLAVLKQEIEQSRDKPAPAPKASEESLRRGGTKSDPGNSASPVLGSVMEQFGKLRQQRSLGRTNNSTLR